MDFASASLGAPACASYAVLRAPFDQWLAEQAEREGAMFVNEIRVDDLIVRDGRVCGVRAGEDDMEAKVVLLADGAVSLLGQKLGMVPPLDPHAMAVSAKEVIQLDEKTVSDRFGCAPGEGCAWLFDGSCTDGHIGGGLFVHEPRQHLAGRGHHHRRHRPRRHLGSRDAQAPRAASRGGAAHRGRHAARVHGAHDPRRRHRRCSRTRARRRAHRGRCGRLRSEHRLLRARHGLRHRVGALGGRGHPQGARSRRLQRAPAWARTARCSTRAS